MATATGSLVVEGDGELTAAFDRWLQGGYALGSRNDLAERQNGYYIHPRHEVEVCLLPDTYTNQKEKP